MIEISTPTADDLDDLFRRDEEAFGGSFTDEQRTTWRGLLDLDRFRIARDGSSLVGVAGSHALELTLPGGALVPMAGTTWVSVAPTHRRQGLLRRLMDAVHADADERGEPVAGLQASEAAIYERFGYGAATKWRHVEIDRRRVDMVERFVPDSAALTMVDPLEHVGQLAEIYDRARRGAAGRGLADRSVDRDAAEGGARAARRRPPSRMATRSGRSPRIGTSSTHSTNCACTTSWRAHPTRDRALWNIVLSHDLVGPIRSRHSVSLDDPLPSLLTDPRQVKTTTVNDFLWLCPRRVGELLAARRYRVADELVVDVDGERWRVEGGPDGAVASATDAEPDVSMTRGGMGALILGGVTATELAAAGRVTATDLPRADVFFGWAPAPHCTTSF